jgi:hypothetical protein
MRGSIIPTICNKVERLVDAIFNVGVTYRIEPFDRFLVSVDENARDWIQAGDDSEPAQWSGDGEDIEVGAVVLEA